MPLSRRRSTALMPDAHAAEARKLDRLVRRATASPASSLTRCSGCKRVQRRRRGQRRKPLTPRRPWLRGLDLNQRPLGYEYNTAMTGNPLISWERRSVAGSSTLSDDASFFVSFHPVSGCYGSKMGAEIRAQSPRLSAASGAGDLATAILVPVRPLRS